jgi:hypothetical protein
METIAIVPKMYSVTAQSQENKVVARDGVEPPTPAFSGLEKTVFSTT